MSKIVKMDRYVKRPVVIEAVQYTIETEEKILEWVPASFPATNDNGDRCVKTPTLEGTMIASLGDYIIKGIKGEFYPCKPDIFMESYSKMDEVDLPDVVDSGEMEEEVL